MSRSARDAPGTATTLPPTVIVTGPTAAGKTEIALALARRFPVRLISADSAQVYRGMDIGTAKPDAATLARYPHALVDLREPEQPYSAAEFERDAGHEIRAARDAGKIPVVVGGTVLYLRALRWGLDPMPSADPDLRRRLAAEAARRGWPALHGRLAELDPASARRIRASDPQRIQRALEICLASGRPASELRRSGAIDRLAGSRHLVVCPSGRDILHKRIEDRFRTMLDNGLVAEVEALMARPGWRRDLPAMRAVGYRQVIDWLCGDLARDALPARGAAATRQLAKRQITALRQWTGAMWYDPLNRRTKDRIINAVRRQGATRGVGWQVD